MSQTIRMKNPFKYPDRVITYLEQSLSNLPQPDCGDSYEIKFSHDEIFILCVGCLTVISDRDLIHIVENRGLNENNIIAAQEFLESHAIFRCTEHGECSGWTFQCLKKYPELDEEALHTDIV